MANLDVKFSISDTTLGLIDELRAGRSREELLRHVMELGLCELLESATRTHRDYTNHTIAGQTKDYRQARHTLFSFDEPDGSPGRRLDPMREVTLRESRG